MVVSTRKTYYLTAPLTVSERRPEESLIYSEKVEDISCPVHRGYCPISLWIMR